MKNLLNFLPRNTYEVAGATDVYCTVSMGKGFGSKGKQHHKHTASESQSHTQ